VPTLPIEELTAEQELDVVRRNYADTKSGKSIRLGDKDVRITVDVELGVGWSVDPTYPVRKRVKVFCTLGEMWVECDVLGYDEETAAHDFQLVGQETVYKLPLAGFKVRFPMLLGQAMPERPDVRRVGEVLEKIKKGYDAKLYETGFCPGIRMGIQKMKEAVWQECGFLEHGDNAAGSPAETKAWAELVQNDGDSNRLQYQLEVLGQKTPHTKMRTMPRWLESDVGRPGDIVWAAWQKRYWPCFVVSNDQYMDLNDRPGTIVSPQRFQKSPDGAGAPVGVYYFGTNERQFISSKALMGFADGLDKGYLKRSKIVKEKRNMSIDSVADFLRTAQLPEVLAEVLQEVNALRLPSEWVNGRLLDPTFVLEEDFDDEEPEYMDVEDKKMVALSFQKEWEPTKAVLDKISSQDFAVVRLGRIDVEHPLFHSETHFYPVGYKIKRKLKSNFTEGTKKMVHTIEILDSDEAGRPSDEPVFKVLVNGRQMLFAKASSPEMQTFLNNTYIKDGRSGMLGKAGATLLGLNRGAIREAVAMLPGVEKCAKVPRDRLEEWRLKFLKQSSSFLLEEMKQCKLPDDIVPVPMVETRPFECQVCGDIEEDEEDLILQCDGCKGCTHMSCYSVTKAPHGDLWLCDVCQARPSEADRPPCVLCPVKGGLMKRTTEGQWCHPGCAIWLPETHIIADERYLGLEGLIGGVKRISSSRREHRCMFCKQIYGAVIQCCEEGSERVTECFKTFHLMCAKNNRCELRMEVVDPTWADDPPDTVAGTEGAVAAGSLPLEEYRDQYRYHDHDQHHQERGSPGTEMSTDAGTELSEQGSACSWMPSQADLERVKKDQYAYTRAEIRGITQQEPFCDNCQATKSRHWRMDAGENVLCDDCGIYWGVHKAPRPLSAAGSGAGASGPAQPSEPPPKRLTSERPRKGRSSKRAKKKKDPPKGVFIGNMHLRSFCPKHSSGGCTDPAQQQPVAALPKSSDVRADPEVPVESLFNVEDGDLLGWEKVNAGVFHKSYVAATSLAPGGSLPTTSSATPNAADAAMPVEMDMDIPCVSNLGASVMNHLEELRSGRFPDQAEPDSEKFPLAVVGACDQDAQKTRNMAEEYDKLASNWRLDVHPGKSAIHGWGAFANRNFKKHEMVIEYVGELVRPTLAEVRETKMYDALVGAGTYVFRLNEDYCVDATQSGNLAHLLNHSCKPNCASRTIRFAKKGQEPKDYVMIYADRDIAAGEELTYDYRFSGDEILKCSCGAVGCRGKVNLQLQNEHNAGNRRVGEGQLRKKFGRE